MDLFPVIPWAAGFNHSGYKVANMAWLGSDQGLDSQRNLKMDETDTVDK